MLKLILQIFLICMLFLYKKHRTLVHFVIFIYQFNLMDKHIRKFIFLNVLFLFHSISYSQGWLPMGSRSQSIANASVAISDLWSYHHNPAASSKVKNFGVGLRRYLFEPDLPQVRILLENRIREQVATYMPYIKIVQIGFSSQFDQPEVASNQLNLKFVYFITSTAETDMIEFTSKPFGGVISS